MNDYCPISLCNVLYKIVTKTLANHVKGCLYYVISHIQSAFVLNHLTMDNALVALEMIHAIRHRKKERWELQL